MMQLSRAVEDILRAIEARKGGAGVCIAAIDGRSASGKSTLAGELSAVLDCPAVHMDDFFLRPEQRTAARLAEPGGNVDRERFLEEVLLPAVRGEEIVYRPYLCRCQALGDSIRVPKSRLLIVEGSYSCHPELRKHYALTAFLTVDPEEQMRRIIAREGSDAAVHFRDLWIPLEEKYFDAFAIGDACDLRFDMSAQNKLE